MSTVSVDREKLRKMLEYADFRDGCETLRDYCRWPDCCREAYGAVVYTPHSGDCPLAERTPNKET